MSLECKYIKLQFDIRISSNEVSNSSRKSIKEHLLSLERRDSDSECFAAKVPVQHSSAEELQETAVKTSMRQTVHDGIWDRISTFYPPSPLLAHSIQKEITLSDYYYYNTAVNWQVRKIILLL